MHRTHFYSAATLLIPVVIFLAGLAEATDVTLVVPTQYSTIQSAINAADAFLTQPTNTRSFEVLVERGTYPGGIKLKNGVQVRGSETAATILTGGDTIMTGDSALSGVTIRNFTIRSAGVGILVPAGSSLVTIENNFFLDMTGAAVQVQTPASATVINNTFYANNTAILRNDANTQIRNNIFSNNKVDISQAALLDQSNIAYNDFNPAPAAGAVIGTNSLPNATITNPDPLFVDVANLDTHLTVSSPCINQGDPSVSDSADVVSTSDTVNSRSDIGAYGGPYTDAIPKTVSGVASSMTSSTSATLSWTASQDYLVKGYKIYYGRVPGPPYNGTDATDIDGNPLASPFDAKKVTSFVVSGLTKTVSSPTAAPIILSVVPQNGSLILSWIGVPDATSYNIYYQESISGTSSPPVNTESSATSYTLTGLKNGVWYDIHVSAVAQAAYYFAVTAYYKQFEPTKFDISESAYSIEQKVAVGSAMEGPQSEKAQGAPDEIVPAPNLPNTGCFIATAAYDSADAQPVRILRDFRDRYLASNAPGRAFIRWYYRMSPELAQALNGHPVLKPLVRIALDPIVAAAFLVTEAPPMLLAMLLLFLVALSTVLRRWRATSSLRS